MTVQKIKFYEDLVEDMKNGNKFQTIRYDWNEYPKIGEEINAISTQKGDIFAHIKITDLEFLSVEECANRNLEGHQNYESPEQLLKDMQKYYDNILVSDDVILFTFEVTEWLR